MSASFSVYVKALPAGLRSLLSSPPYTIECGLPGDIPEAGIYLFSSGKRHLYVGRSDNIRQRMRLHTRPSAGHNQATFAFKIAKRALGIVGPSYRHKGSRGELELSRAFRRAFSEAKMRVRVMQVRFLNASDPVMQTLLEVYISLKLKTPYNEFKTT